MTLETHNNTEPNSHKRTFRRNWRERRLNSRAQKQFGFRVIEKMFYYYRLISRAVEEARAEQGYYRSGGKTGGVPTNHAFVSDSTATIAMRHSEPLPKVIINADTMNEDIICQPEKWLRVINQTLAHFDNEDKMVSKVLRCRYFQNETAIRTCIDLNISDNRYYDIRDYGLQYAREYAIQLGLIRIFDDKDTAL